jgi:hypothetical protein
MLGGTRQRLKLLRLVYASDSAVAAFERGDLTARTDAGRAAMDDIREGLHVLRYEMPQLDLTPVQRRLLKAVAAQCPDPQCTGQCSGGWVRLLGDRRKDPLTARSLASAGLLEVVDGKLWTAVHVTPLGRIFAARMRGDHGDWPSHGPARRASSWR